LGFAVGSCDAGLCCGYPRCHTTGIKIGGVLPFSGPVSALGIVGKGILAYVQSINDRGGINGRKVDYIALDDAYSPPKTVEDVRRLVESDEVARRGGSPALPS
jgi:branched-chain amino acid transport system substrate-binding protein